ncbi:MAG: nucleotide disphospho-sugar-binding domain-containing protein [Terracidiphilus sp.]|jgi:UDP:flavonoid glycosyltransferase YjiC (YdhE family)
MARIAFLMLPEPGHLQPTFRVAARLLQCGHEVHYLTLPQFREDCETQGFKFSPMLSRISSDESGPGSLFETLRAGSALYRSVVPRLHAEGKTVLEEIKGEVASICPDLLIVDTGMMVLESIAGLRRSPQERTDPLHGLGFGLLQLSPCFTEMYGGLPLPTLNPGIPEAILCPQEFDLPDARPSQRERYFVEPSVLEWRRLVPFPWEWIDPKKRLVYCSFGTQSSAYESANRALTTALQAFADNSEYQLVIAAGGHVDETTFGILPKNVLLRTSVPQIEILRRATVLITHGGLGTLKEAILSAVPMIVMPFSVDQPYNAQRVTHHGLGCAFPPQTVTAENLRTAARQLEDSESVHNKLREFQQIFARTESEAPSIALIERLLASKNLETCGKESFESFAGRTESIERRQRYLNRRRPENLEALR